MLPSSDTPLYNHPLPALEQWLLTTGFKRVEGEPCRWQLHLAQWSAQLELQSDGLKIIWSKDGQTTSRHFSYGLSRTDMEAALLAGP
ncbi:MAG: DUF3143 domain-containing protein [Synechococcus lacustris]|jgi:hypothetical protein